MKTWIRNVINTNMMGFKRRLRERAEKRQEISRRSRERRRKNLKASVHPRLLALPKHSPIRQRLERQIRKEVA